ncbi:MAG: tetratricopeptide repeat protein [Candidatus Omnitrophica bacterium]|nr:tetratricopeptide repeat protein [Candidatus Omnitrophota bacterium]
MKKQCFSNKRMALVFLALFLYSTPAFSQSLEVDYLCELGKTFYIQGKIDDALSEFTKILLVDPNNQQAKEYINKIFNGDLGYKDEPAIAESSASLKPPIVTQEYIAVKPQVASLATQTKVPVLSKEEAMDQTLNNLKSEEVAWLPAYTPAYTPTQNVGNKEEEKRGYKVGALRVSGDMQLSFGVTPNDFIWKRANFDLNEKVKSWRMSSDAVFNNRFNTFDPRVYDSLSVNLDTENIEGFNLHSNVTVDPWSFVGKSNKTTITGSNGDTAEIQLLYWSNTGYVVNDTVYTSRVGDSFGIPEIKVSNNETVPTTVNGYRNFGPAATFNIPEMKIHREFQPLRELWLDYINDQIKFRAFPMAYQDQAYASDDPLGVTNHHIWWQESTWLRSYTPGNYNSADIPVPSFTKGFWDDSLSFISKDSTGKYLTALRGFSFSFQPQEETLFDTTVATPKNLWQDYNVMDNLITASRLKHYLAENFMIAGTFTSRLGFNVNDKNKLDSQNYVGGVDLGYEIADGLKAQAEVLTSKSFYDQTNSDYETESRGNAYYFSFVTRYPQQSIMDLKYGYEEIALDKGESFLIKSKFYASRMDKGFDSSLSNYHNTRQDTFWSRHIHFRKPFEYYSAGLTKPANKWDELMATRIGDGIDSGRNVWGFRIETIAEDQFTNLFDVRNVHDVNGKFIENVVRDELMLKITDKLTSKLLGIYQKLPNTLGGVDPFIYDGNTGKFFNNASVPDGNDPTIKTGSIGLNYDFFDWLSLDGIYERTNDYTLAYDSFPSNTLRNDTTLYGTFYQNDKLYRYRDPFLYSQGAFPQAPYEFYNVFKSGLRMQPLCNMDIYLDYTRNEFESAGQNTDSMNHVGIEMTYMPCEKIGMVLKYTYSRWQDTDRLVAGSTNPLGHHNFYSEFRYLPSKDDELILQYGEGNVSIIGNSTLDPYGGSALTIDTAHIFRAYYRRKF